jgi:hypothetical protein
MPITATDADPIRFLYRPGHVVDAFGQDLLRHPTPRLRTDSFSGGSQLIPFKDGWLGIIHEAHVYTDRPWKRYYSHRFVYYDAEFRFARVSPPFFFKDKVIEFVAGLAWHPDSQESVEPTFIISFGFRDCEAWLARVPASEVWDFILRGQKEPE